MRRRASAALEPSTSGSPCASARLRVYAATRPCTRTLTQIDSRLRSDTDFYTVPKLVYHIDEGAVAALTHFYDKRIADGSEILDICSSWVSHYPRDFPGRMKAIVGTGINELELKCNDQLTQYAQADLNVKPKLPFPDKSFDFVTCVVSFDYLNQPLAVMREVARVLRPGGQLILSQSNRCRKAAPPSLPAACALSHLHALPHPRTGFFTKAVGVWTRDMSDAAHLRVLGTYIHFAGSFEEPRAFDISAKGVGTNDPMYVVTASRRA